MPRVIPISQSSSRDSLRYCSKNSSKNCLMNVICIIPVIYVVNLLETSLGIPPGTILEVPIVIFHDFLWISPESPLGIPLGYTQCIIFGHNVRKSKNYSRSSSGSYSQIHTWVLGENPRKFLKETKEKILKENSEAIPGGTAFKNIRHYIIQFL